MLLAILILFETCKDVSKKMINGDGKWIIDKKTLSLQQKQIVWNRNITIF